jgi:hypothetical protein
MKEMFGIRNVDDGTRKFILSYASEHDMTIAEALRELMGLVREHLAEKKTRKKYKSIFDTYEKAVFSTGDPHLSEKIDDIVYGSD